MHAFDPRRRQASDHRPVGLDTPTLSSQDARQGVIEHNMLYVLVIGLAGAIFANAVILLGFILLISAK